jgi:ELWxxDGT repeat protein
VGDTLYVTTESSSDYSTILWRSDGTAAGTRPVDSSPLNLLHLTVSGPRLFFIGDEGEHGMELWSLKQGAWQQPRR